MGRLLVLNIPDHPEIVSAMLTGYGTMSQPESLYCEFCDNCLDDEEVYYDNEHDFLCKKCLLLLHEVKPW